MFVISTSAVIENQSPERKRKRIPWTANAAESHSAAVSPARTPVVDEHRNAETPTTASIGRKSR